MVKTALLIQWERVQSLVRELNPIRFVVQTNKQTMESYNTWTLVSGFFHLA